MNGEPARAACPSTRAASTSACCTVSVPAGVAGPVAPPITQAVTQAGWPRPAQRRKMRAVSTDSSSGELVFSTINARGVSAHCAP